MTRLTTQLNNDYCETCRGHDRFLCCDGCPRSFHFACVNPPLDVDEMPFPNGTLLPKRKGDAKNDPRAARADADDSWFCQVCFAARLPPKPVRNAGPFGVLVQKLERENPSIFSLPAELRNYFKGVSTGADGAGRATGAGAGAAIGAGGAGAAAGAGAALAMLFAVMTQYLLSNQVATGLALVLFGLGLTAKQFGDLLKRAGFSLIGKYRMDGRGSPKSSFYTRDFTPFEGPADGHLAIILRMIDGDDDGLG